MTNGRLALVATAAIASFMALALLAVDRLTAAPPPPRRAATPQLATAAGAGPVEDPQAERQAAAFRADHPGAGLAGVNLNPTMEREPPPPPPPKGSWEAVSISPRAASLGKAGVALGQELNELHPQLSACFDEDSQARHGTAAVAAVRDAAPQDDAGVTVLVLQLETMPDAIRIADAPVETRGAASDGLLACAQSKLRGRVAVAPGTRAGERHRLLYTLLP